jgi:hypothetical protein
VTAPAKPEAHRGAKSVIDLERGVLTIERNRTTVGYQVVEGDPKTPAGRRAVALDKRSVQILRVHRR